MKCDSQCDSSATPPVFTGLRLRQLPATPLDRQVSQSCVYVVHTLRQPAVSNPSNRLAGGLHSAPTGSKAAQWQCQ